MINLSQPPPTAGRRNRSSHVALLAAAGLLAAGAVVLSGGATASAASVPGQGTPFDCSGSTVYAIQRPTPDQVGSTGTIDAVDTAGVAGSNASLTPITTVPKGGSANGLAITAGGKRAYLVDKVPSGSGITIHTYRAATQKWSTLTGTATPGDVMISGAIDPMNGYYYYLATQNSNPTEHLYAYDTRDHVAVPGIVGTLDQGYVGDEDGDLAFDAAGDLFVLSSGLTALNLSNPTANPPTAVLDEVSAASVPTAGTGAALPETLVHTFADPNAEGWDGLAFDNQGHAFVQIVDATLGTSTLTELVAATGVVLAGPSTELTSPTRTLSDLGACSFGPTVSFRLSLAGRIAPTDEFGLRISSSLPGVVTATTTGTQLGLQPAVAGPEAATAGAGYAFFVTGTDQFSYQSSFSCVDANNPGPVVLSGSGPMFSLTMPAPPTGRTGQNIVCTLTMAP